MENFGILTQKIKHMNQQKNIRNYVTLIILLAAIWLLTGCIIPHTSPRADEVHGRVLDAKTQF